MSRTIASGVAAIVLTTFPFIAYAFPFGGQASLVHNCWNLVVYAILGPPIGGPYVWTFATKTYQFGRPTHAGQWLLGLSGPPYYCIYNILPLDVRPGISIMMMGSSQ